MNREQNKTSARGQEPWDVVIIGGGATGLGCAVDAATRGYRTLLLERADFACATSSRSTKLVHGGVRYLEQGDIPLVLEALRERGLLHQNAPHLVHHLSFIVPRYKWWEGPFFGIGLKVYDALAGKLNLAPSRLLDRSSTLRQIPNIEPEGLLGGVEYFDGQFDDARLAITLARTAEAAGACLLNYAPVTGLLKTDGLISGVEFEDAETGEKFRVEAYSVINATGIFSDSIRGMDCEKSTPSVQPSQGVHLVLDREFLPGNSAIMVPHTDDGRVLFVIPWHGKVLVGTTDTPMAKPDEEPRALPEEVEFILRNAARYLARRPGRNDLLSIFAGQRPLVRPPSKDGTPTKSISRNHEILVSDSGLITIVGGKWTTYRKMAEDTINHAAALAGLPDQPCVTMHHRLQGWSNSHSAAPPTTPGEDMLRCYGTETQDLLALAKEKWGELLHPKIPIPKAAVLWAVRHEMARTVEDVLARRIRALFLDAAAAAEAAPEVASILAEELGWSTEKTKKEIHSFQTLARGYLPL